MFKDSAKYYDVLKSYKNYQEESRQIKQIINEYHVNANSILHLACGSAEHDRYLKNIYNVDGLDLNQDFVQLAKKKNPNGSYFVGDMTDFSLNQKYDVIICVYGSVGYAKTLEQLNSMFTCCKNHLNKDGLFIIEPWYNKENWKTDFIHKKYFETEEVSICRMAKGNENGSILFHYLVADGDQVQYFTEEYSFGLFSQSDLINAFENIGMTALYRNDVLQKKGLYIGKFSYPYL